MKSFDSTFLPNQIFLEKYKSSGKNLMDAYAEILIFMADVNKRNAVVNQDGRLMFENDKDLNRYNVLIKNGTVGEKYNISGEKEVSNLEMAQMIAKFMHKENELKYEMVDFHSSRPGHDLRYGLDGSKLFEMGFKLPLNFEESLRKTVEWTLQNLKWLEE